MAINVNRTITDEAEFYRQLREFIGQFEGDTHIAYLDSALIPTIGVGFNLRSQVTRNKVFTVMGIDKESAVGKDLYRVIFDTAIKDNETLQNELDEVYGAFYMTPEQIDQVFKELIADDVAAVEAAGSMPHSKESIALASVSYNNLFGPGLKAALNLDNPYEARAEAWYQIRYVHVNQLHKRRYAEAALFGLYESSPLK